MKPLTEKIKEKPWFGWLLFFATVIVVFLLGLLASSIIERRAEAGFAYKPEVEIDDLEPRNNIWGMNFPQEYETYKMTADNTFRSLFNGSATIDMLGNYPELVILWAGYPFSQDYSQGRGHYHAVEDVWNSLRTGAPTGHDDGPMPGTCWTCKSSDISRLINKYGAEIFYKKKWAAWGHEVTNPIGCADCHDPKTMNLRITRPALIEAYERQGKDITKASYQEMRSLVCAQCHVEYYFKGDGKYLVFPWDKGMGVEDMEKYYDEYEFADWVHTLSKAPMIKAQHPDYEVFTTGVHYERGVACADCHMPYQSQGGQKFTSHWVQSPLNNITTACQVCHRESEETLTKNVYDRQKKVAEVRKRTEALITRAHIEAKACWDAGAKNDEMKPVLMLIRQAQWRWDYVAAGHGNSFHSPLETTRILSAAIEKAQDARLAIYGIIIKYGKTWPVAMPDISTKEKAQAYIGLKMKELKADKAMFKATLLPEWIKQAKEREEQMPIKRL